MSISLPNKDRFSLREVAAILDKHISTVWRWTLRPVRGRLLKTSRIGAQRYVEREDLEAFLAQSPNCAENSPQSSECRNIAMTRIESELERAGL
jgi:transposase